MKFYKNVIDNITSYFIFFVIICSIISYITCLLFEICLNSLSFRLVLFTLNNDMYEYRNVESIKFFRKQRSSRFISKFIDIDFCKSK